jgi:hypothetical protein
MSKYHYFADGYLLEDEKAPNRQSAWVCMFNPTLRDAEMKFTFYYEKSEPTTMVRKARALTGANMHLLSCPEVRQNERFGCKIECTEPMVIQITTGYYGVADKADWYTHAMHSVICGDQLSRVNYYADALVIDVPGQRLKEPEWAFLLNPHPEPVEVMLSAHYSDGSQKEYPFTVPAERVLPVFMDDLVIKNKVFGARYISSLPIAIQQTRLIVEEDRQTIRACFSVMAKPGPLFWQEDGL